MTDAHTPTTLQPETPVDPPAAPPADLAETALVEEVSIDGMCGVY